MEATVSVKGQMVIPAGIRKKFGIEKGGRVVIEVKDKCIILKPVTSSIIEGLRGSLRGSGALKHLMEERARDREGGS